MLNKYLSILKTIFYNRKRLLHYPRFITYTVTFKCNAMCIMCDSWKRKYHDDLNITEIEKIFQQLREIDAIRLSGGEPFIRKDFKKIIKLADKYLKPSIIHITTNGILTENIVNIFNSINTNAKIHLKISIDGNEKKHNKIRGVKNGYNRAIETLKELNRNKRSNIYIGVNQTIVDEECIEQYYHLKEICSTIGVGLHVVLAYNDSAFYNYDRELSLSDDFFKYKLFADFNSESLKKVFQIISKDSNSIDNFIERKVKLFYLEGLKNRILKKIEIPNPKCTATYSHLRIMPNGDVPVCLYNTSKLGNLRDQSFKELWFDNRNDVYRKFVNRCSGCWAGCEIIPSAIYSGEIIKSLFKIY